MPLSGVHSIMMEKSAQAQARPSPSLYVPSQSCGVRSSWEGRYIPPVFLLCPCGTLWSYQWTKARLAYMRSNLWSSLAHASMMAVVLDRQHTARCTCNTMDKWTMKTTNTKCRLFFKIDLLTDFVALCLTDYIDWRYIHQRWAKWRSTTLNLYLYLRHDMSTTSLTLKKGRIVRAYNAYTLDLWEGRGRRRNVFFYIVIDNDRQRLW